MLDILSSVAEAIAAFANFIIQSIVSLFSFIANIPVYFNFITVLMGSLPAFILPYAVAGVSLTIVAMLISRKII